MIDVVHIVLVVIALVHAQPAILGMAEHGALMALFNSLGCSTSDCPRGTPITACGSNLSGSGKRIFTCGAGAIRTINMNDMQLTGTIPSEIGSFTLLTEFRLARNNITGTIPPVFWSLNTLTVLDLSNNKLFGEIPSFFPGSFQNGLTDIDLTNNFLSGPLPNALKGTNAPNRCNIQKLNDTNCVLCPSAGFPTVNTKCECFISTRVCPGTATTTFATATTSTTTSTVPSTTVVSTSSNLRTRPIVSLVRSISFIDISNLLSANLSSMASTLIAPASETVNNESVDKERVNNDDDNDNNNNKSSDNDALIGGIVGGVVALLLIAGIIAVLMVRRSRSKKVATSESGSNDNRVSVSAADTEYGTMNESYDGDDGQLPSYNDVGDVRKGNNAYY